MLMQIMVEESFLCTIVDVVAHVAATDGALKALKRRGEPSLLVSTLVPGFLLSE